MKRFVQTESELLDRIAAIDVDWRDDHFDAVWALLEKVPEQDSYVLADLAQMLDRDFDAAYTSLRLVLDLSKDGFQSAMREEMGQSSVGKKGYITDRGAYLKALDALGVTSRLSGLASRGYTWKDILAERLKTGRGSAIRGQRRGRLLEDFAEEQIKQAFGEDGYEARCSFVGADGEKSAKCDFAIPSSEDPRIVVESKAYGATGSKQTDVLGDTEKIIRVKRHDTHFLLVTDGITWRERRADLRKLIRLQNQGKIARIYTRAMQTELLEDLRTLRAEHSL